MTFAPPSIAGIVAIGRNEGERLRLCLESARRDAQSRNIVYVDSGSSDGSIEVARSMGVEVVELDMSQPFTAARARNAGIARLREIAPPELEFVQVVDGDCELVEGWIPAAIDALRSNVHLAVVCGRRRERFPDASIYNRLCDMEWDTPIGMANSCGGDAMIRLRPFDDVGGYDNSVIAGEEPEMCWRLRRAGWRILRLDHAMTLHDAQLSRFGQWWKRAVRSGHAYAEGAAMHGASTERFRVRELRSILFWALLLPLGAIVLAPFTYGVSLLMLSAYIVLWWRVRRHRLAHGDSPQLSSHYAKYLVIGKFAQLIGIGQYWFNRLLGRRTKLIEYRQPAKHISTSPQPREASHAG